MIWLIYDQTGKLKEARNYESQAQQHFKETKSVFNQHDELPLLKQKERKILEEIEQLVYLYAGQGLPIPHDCVKGENLIIVKDGLDSYLDVRVWLPKKKRVSVWVEKIEGARIQPPKPTDFLKVNLEKAGWHSITSKLENSESGNRLPLLVNGEEVYSIDFGKLKSQGGSSYSPGSLPRTLQIKQNEDKADCSVAHHWNLMFNSKSGTPMPYGYGVEFLSFERSDSGATSTSER